MKKTLGDIVFWFHIVFVLFWYALFFVPVNVWPDKILFHFYLTLGVVIHQIVWGLIIMPWTGRYRMVCMLTTIAQLLRGEDIANPNNYDHSSTREFLAKFGITKVPHRISTIIAFIVLILVSIQYFTYYY